MPSFDIVSEVNFQEVDNAVNQVAKEIGQRFDFRGSKSNVDYDKNSNKINILADDEFKLRAIHQLLDLKLAKRDINPKCLKYGKTESVSGGNLKQILDLKVGLDKEEAKQINKAIKDSKLKVTSQIQDDQVRVSGKSIDDLQTVQKMLKDQNFDFALQFVNLKR